MTKLPPCWKSHDSDQFCCYGKMKKKKKKNPIIIVKNSIVCSFAFIHTTVNPFITTFITTENSLLHHFAMHRMALLFCICILYNSNFSLMSKYLGTNAVVIKRVHHIFFSSPELAQDKLLGYHDVRRPSYVWTSVTYETSKTSVHQLFSLCTL